MTEQELSLVAFTAQGARLMGALQRSLGGEAVFSKDVPDFSLADWTEERFASRQALVFVGAAGIAVRAIAPHIKSKAQDPAVVAVDEAGRFVIPLLSGHLGGANALAQRIAAICGGTAVITTATDINGLWAVDLWAKAQGLTVVQPERIKLVSGKLLQGDTVSIYSRWPIAGEPPAGVAVSSTDRADVIVDLYDHGQGLHLAPKVGVLGLGCRRGTPGAALEEAFCKFCSRRALLSAAISQAASIDVKSDEAGLRDFCRAHSWPLSFFTATELAACSGSFTPSAFVERTVGVDNVCERSAVLASGGELLETKYAGDGVTMALACTVPQLDWSW